MSTVKKIPCFSASDIQKTTITDVYNKIVSNKYKFKKSICPICNFHENILILDTERNNLPCRIVQCKKCGLLRNEFFFTEETCAEFYATDYHKMNFGNEFATREYFYEQNKVGLRYYNILKSIIGNFSGKKIIEIGCSSGGILYPFMRRGNHCIGYDYNTNYMKFGNALGLDLRIQDGNIENNADILILSHCLEHLPNPITELKKLKSYLKPNGILIAEVPNIYRFNHDYLSLQHYFTIAHLFHFTPYHFSTIIKLAGFIPCYQNEYTTIVAKQNHSSDISIAIDLNEGRRLRNFLNSFLHWEKPSPQSRYKHKIKTHLKKIPFYSKLVKVYHFVKTHHTPQFNQYKVCYINGEDITSEELFLIKKHAQFYTSDDTSILYQPNSIIPESFPVLNFGNTQQKNKNFFDIDWRMNPLDAWEWCRLSDYIHGSVPDIEKSKKIFFDWKTSMPQMSKAYIFGTGPSLDKAIEHDWSDGYRIVCNTIVKNKKMWDHISPHIIVAGDALYHFSDEKFASNFRKDLQLRLHESPKCLFVYPSIFDGIIRRTTEISPDQLVPIPLGRQFDIHHTIERFELPSLGNVLGLLLLPLASYLSKYVYLWGFDGRSPSDSLFWKNSPKQHYSEDVEELRVHHPAFYSFFCPEHDQYFYEKLNFGDRLEKSLCRAEKEGWIYNMLHFSWTSTLNKRFSPKK